MKYDKYDYLEAAKQVMDRTVIGFLASLYLMIVAVCLFLFILIVLAKIFGFLSIIVVGVLVSISIIVGMTIYRVKKKGYRYAKY